MPDPGAAPYRLLRDSTLHRAGSIVYLTPSQVIAGTHEPVAAASLPDRVASLESQVASLASQVSDILLAGVPAAEALPPPAAAEQAPPALTV